MLLNAKDGLIDRLLKGETGPRARRFEVGPRGRFQCGPISWQRILRGLRGQCDAPGAQSGASPQSSESEPKAWSKSWIKLGALIFVSSICPQVFLPH